MSITTTTTDDLMNSYAALITETLPHNNNNPELQLSINDLVNPTEKAETLLETLSNEQLNIIEQTLFKIKERKLGPATGGDGGSLSASPSTILVQDTPNNTDINDNSNTVAITTATNSKIGDMSTATTGTSSSESQDWNSTATKVAKALANVISLTSNEKDQDPTATNNATIAQSNKCTKPPNNNSHEPTTELREGVEWVSFVYSHHRTLRRYCIRTDLDKVDISILDDKFKKENCVYPRANLPRESYRGNRWAYETECNVLGWKLAYLNMEEIAGKRGLIQRAVDSYRNRYPSMRSRRVARQEKLLKGTLRKRKQHKEEPQQHLQEQVPKTILIEENNENKCRIRINIESVVLDAIDMAFRKNNCVFPRSMNIHPETTPTVSQRRLDEAKCNEIGWKLAWLNPRQLANKKNFLQRALDIYRSQFTTDLKPRKYASRVPPAPFTAEEEKEIAGSEDINMEEASITKQDDQPTINTKLIPLTEQALANQQKELMELDHTSNSNPHNFTTTTSERRNSVSGQSCYSGTTVTLDFHDYCFSPPAEEEDDEMGSFEDTLLSTAANSPTYMSSTMFDDLVALGSSLESNMLRQDKDGSSLSDNNNDGYENTMSQHNSPSPNYSSTSSSSNNTSCSSSTASSSNNNNQVESLSMLSLNEMYQQALLLDPTATLFNNTNIAASKDDEDTTIFDTGFDDANQLLNKYETVNAGMDDFTGPLLNQLF